MKTLAAFQMSLRKSKPGKSVLQVSTQGQTLPSNYAKLTDINFKNTEE